MDEPTLLDVLRASLTFWRRRPAGVPSLWEALTGAPSAGSGGASASHPQVSPSPTEGSSFPPAWWPPTAVSPSPVALLLALGLALAGQVLLEPPRRGPLPGVALYLVAAAALVRAVHRGQLFPPTPPATLPLVPTVRPRWWLVAAALGLTAAVVAATGSLRLTPMSLTLWLAAVAAAVAAALSAGRGTAPAPVVAATHPPRRDWTVTIPRWAAAAAVGIGVVVVFRCVALDQVPAEMVSEHAELLQDVAVVRAGEWPVLFAGSWVREGLHSYLAAAVSALLGEPISFLALKLPTVLAGLLTLPCLVLLGREVGGLRVGLLAAFFAGVAGWPNVISRLGLPFALAPLFVALALAALLAGLRTGRRGPFVLAGLGAGLGLCSASIGRAGVLAAVVAAAVSLAAPVAADRRRPLLLGLSLAALVTLAVAAPLLGAAMAAPDAVFHTALTRMTAAERPLPGHPLVLTVTNLGRALAMFGWSGGQTWLCGPPDRPALELVAAALFHLGLGLVLVTAWRRPSWPALAVVAALPALLAPSFLALALPAENPSLERAAGALVPAFVLVGVGANAVFTGLRRRVGGLAAAGAMVLLAAAAGVAGWRVALTEYGASYRQQTWNTSELGAVARSFVVGTSAPDTVHVLPAAHWVDTRLVAVAAGLAGRDLALPADALTRVARDPRPHLFLLHPGDEEGRSRLVGVFPTGVLARHRSAVQGKDFLTFFVPPRPGGGP